MINTQVLALLRSRDLLASEWSGAASTVGLRQQAIDYQDRYDADTVAAMAGNLAVALNGTRALPDRWLDELEYRGELIELAARLWVLGLGGTGAEQRASY